MAIEKISKICWNDFGWTRPSGTHGKSPSLDAYENQQGFGHEEWIFDKSKIVNGFHYGFLQPLNLKTDLHVGKTYSIWLYSITSRQRVLVGKVDGAIPIWRDESAEIYKIYKHSGWIREMVKDLENAGLNPTFLKETPADAFFNVKFRIKSIKVFDDFPIISNNDPNLTSTRYKLLNKVSDFKIAAIKKKGTDIYSRQAGGKIFVDPYHNKLQNALSAILVSSADYRNIKIEDGYVDVQATYKDNSIHFFEIKTDTPKNCIRQAIGQLLEYSMYPDKQFAGTLIVVGDTEAPKDVKDYIRHLREITGLRLYYRCINMEKNSLSDGI